MPHNLPRLEVSEIGRRLTPLSDARGWTGDHTGRLPGEELAALREAVPDFRAAVISSGTPAGVRTCPLVTLPFPTQFGLWRAAQSPAPYLWFTNRMVVVQWREGEGKDGRTRTLLWEPSDWELGEATPFFASATRKLGPVPRSVVFTEHGTVLGHLRVLGIDPADVDYLVFDHLHTQDVRRLVGTTRPARDLGYPDRPVPAWFPNAVLLTQAREWESIRHLHPLQAPWYQPETYVDLPHDRLRLLDGDTLLGPGVALMATPGHTAGNQSLVLHTDRGLWTSSENGVAAESWRPRASKIRGVASWAAEWGQEVILNANTLEFTAWQYNSMVVESLVADPTPDGDFPQCFPSSELVRHKMAPGTAPTFRHEQISHGALLPSAPLVVQGT